MTIKVFSLLLLASAALGNPFCGCGLGSGEDICNPPEKKCPLVVRPCEVPKPILNTKTVSVPVLPLSPIAGPCSCHKSLVTPAVVPKPACLASSGLIDLTNNRQLTLSQRQQILFGSNTNFQQQNPVPVIVDGSVAPICNSGNPATFVPADPVSLGVAYKLSQQDCRHNEDKLSFGFRSIPKDVPLCIKKQCRNIPEEELFNLNGQIVELKAKKCQSTQSLDEEAREQLLEMQEEDEEERLNSEIGANVKQISLAEIGYGPARIKDPQFINLPQTGTVTITTDENKNNMNCYDGFQPGQVVVAEVPQQESYVIPEAREPCAEGGFISPSDTLPIKPGFNVVNPAGFSIANPFTSIISSSSASGSSASSWRKNHFLQKIGCSK